MTTNAGASDMASEGIGFGNVSKEDASEEAVKRMFTPEFRNRLDAIVPFGYLPTEVVARVVDKFILQLELQLADRNVHIELDDEARAWLTERGYDKLYGARPMGRLVQEKIKQPLAEELLFGKLVHGGEVKVRIKDNAPAFEIIPAPPKPPKSKKKAGRRQGEAEAGPARRAGLDAASSLRAGVRTTARLRSCVCPEEPRHDRPHLLHQPDVARADRRAGCSRRSASPMRRCCSITARR